MQIIKFAVGVISSSQTHTVSFPGDATIRHLSDYLRRQSNVRSGLIELAQPVTPDQRLISAGMRVGDRLLILTERLSEASPLPPVLDLAEYPYLVLLSGDHEVSSGSKARLVLGRAEGSFVPDIDMDYLVGKNKARYMSSRCAELWVDKQQHWWIKRLDDATRIRLDENEIKQDQRTVSLTTGSTLRFYRQADLICELGVRVDTFRFGRASQAAPTGAPIDLPIVIGDETSSNLILRASDEMTFSTLVRALSQTKQIPASDSPTLYLLHPIPAKTCLKDVQIESDNYLYAGSDKSEQVESLLYLKDLQTGHPFPVEAGLAGEIKLIGCRGARRPLAVDLSSLHNWERISREQAELVYRDDTWWIQLPPAATTAVFVNTTRLTHDVHMPLNSGDVLSLGPSVDQYNIRLEVILSPGLQVAL
jgi:hypothetical protein